MRMKKLMILAVAAIALAACSRTFEHHAVEGTPIGFGTWTETLTKARAAANDNTAFANGEAFDVYGFKTIPGDTPTNSVVFNGEDVTATVSGSSVTWDYTQKRFWDPAASSYTFFAVLPANQLGEATQGYPYATTGRFNSSTISFNNPNALSNDILVGKAVATPSGNGPYSYTAYQQSPYVQIQFNHIASCIDLKLKKDSQLGNAEVKITALSLLNIENSGTFAVSGYGDSSPYYPTVAWTPAETPTYLETTASTGEYSVTLPSGGATASGSTTYTNHVASTEGTPGEVFSGYVFMPQTIHTSGTKQGIKFTYSISVGGEDPIVYADNIIDFCNFLTDDKDIKAANYTETENALRILSWAPKTKYTFIITIGAANAITFSATVNNWELSGTGYQYLVQ